MNFKYNITLNITILYILLQLFIHSANCSEKSISTFAYFSDDNYLFSSCSCYTGNKYYTCTSFHTYTGIASFVDPLPVVSGKTYVINKIKVEFKGDPFCHDSTTSIFDLHLKLNGQSISPLQKTGKYNCECQCLTISNTTTKFPSSSYNFGGVNSITTQVKHSTEACYQGYTVVIYYEEKSVSASHTPTGTRTPTHTPTPSKNSQVSATPSPVPSPVASPPASSEDYQCCVYVNQANGAYDVTCVPSSHPCAPQDNTVLVAHVPTANCNSCFDV